MLNDILEEEESFTLKEEKEENSISSNYNKYQYDESENEINYSSLSPLIPLNVLKISSENFIRKNITLNNNEEENLSGSIFCVETLENTNYYNNNKNKNILSIEKNINFEISSKKKYIENNEENEDLNFLFKLKKIKNEEKTKSQIKNSTISDSTNFTLKKRKENKIFKIKKTKLKYKILSKEEKKQILKDLKNNSIKNISLKYNVSIRNLTRWKKQGIERKKGSGRKFKDPYLEEKMLKYYYENKNITTKEFRLKAKMFCSDSSFKASTGWLMRIKKKFNLVFEKY